MVELKPVPAAARTRRSSTEGQCLALDDRAPDVSPGTRGGASRLRLSLLPSTLSCCTLRPRPLGLSGALSKEDHDDRRRPEGRRANSIGLPTTVHF